MRFSERLKIYGDTDVEVPAAVTTDRVTETDIDDQQVIGGGRLELYVRHNATIKGLGGLAGKTVQFIRWHGDGSYRIASAEPVKRGRFVRIMLERAS